MNEYEKDTNESLRWRHGGQRTLVGCGMNTIQMDSNHNNGNNSICLQEKTQMAFVVERIPEEAIQGFLSEHRVYNGKAAPLTSRWAVDHERNAQIALTGKVGGSYEGTQETQYFSLYWNGEQIRLAADPIGKTYPSEGKVEMNWKVYGLEIPHGLQARRAEVVSLIKNAFQAVGYTFNGDRFTSVDVKFADDVAK